MEDTTNNIPEEVLDRRRLENGQLEYLIGWKDLPRDDNSWVSKNDSCCKDLIKQFEKKRKRDRRKQEKNQLESKKNEKVSSNSAPVLNDTSSNDGMSQRWCDIHENAEVEYVIACGKMDDQTIQYLVHWKGTELADLVSSKEMREKFPQELIKYHESKIRFSDPGKDFNQNTVENDNES